MPFAIIYLMGIHKILSVIVSSWYKVVCVNPQVKKILRVYAKNKCFCFGDFGLNFLEHLIQ